MIQVELNENGRKPNLNRSFAIDWSVSDINWNVELVYFSASLASDSRRETKGKKYNFNIINNNSKEDGQQQLTPEVGHVTIDTNIVCLSIKDRFSDSFWQVEDGIILSHAPADRFTASNRLQFEAL